MRFWVFRESYRFNEDLLGRWKLIPMMPTSGHQGTLQLSEMVNGHIKIGHIFTHYVLIVFLQIFLPLISFLRFIYYILFFVKRIYGVNSDWEYLKIKLCKLISLQAAHGFAPAFLDHKDFTAVDKSSFNYTISFWLDRTPTLVILCSRFWSVYSRQYSSSG